MGGVSSLGVLIKFRGSIKFTRSGWLAGVGKKVYSTASGNEIGVPCQDGAHCGI